MAERYRKKPVVVEAIQIDPLDYDGTCEIVAWCGGAAVDDGGHVIAIDTLEGRMFARPGDWIIKGVQGEFYPCKPDIFAATYEPADPPLMVLDATRNPAVIYPVATGISREGIRCALESYCQSTEKWTGYGMAEDLFDAYTVCLIPEQIRVQDIAAVLVEPLKDPDEPDLSAAADAVWALIQGDGNRGD